MKRKVLGLMMATFVAALPVFVNAEEGSVKIGEKLYPTLKEAVEAVAVCEEESCETTTISVLEDHETAGIKVASGKYLTIDLGGFTVTFKEPTVGSEGTETQDMQLLKNSTIVIKNGKLVSSDTESSKMLIQNYANLTLKDVEIDATNELSQYALSNNSGVVSIEGTTSIKATKVAFDVYGWYKYYPNGPQVTVDTTGTIEGKIEVTADSSTATKELSLVIKNINHVGEVYIQEGLEKNVTIEAGSYTDENATEKLPVEEGSEVYEVVTQEGEIKYVVAAEEDLVEAPYIEATEFVSEEDKKELVTELDGLLKEIEEDIKILEESENVDEETLAQVKKVKEVYTKLNEIFTEKERTIISVSDIVYGSMLDNNFVVNSNKSTLDKVVKLTLELPENLEKVKEGYTRKYSVIRFHESEKEDGSYDLEVTELDATEKDGNVSFETDKFSMYILTYKDVANTKNPNTFDGISLYMIIASVSLIGLVSLIAYSKKAKNY